jgi:dihydroorotase
MNAPSHTITINFTHDEAEAFSKLLKHMDRQDFIAKASGEQEALKMEAAARVVNIALAEIEMSLPSLKIGNV